MTYCDIRRDYYKNNALKRSTPFPDNLLRDKWKTVRDRLVLLITNRQSHTGFRLVPKSMTLNDLERHNRRRRALPLR